VFFFFFFRFNHIFLPIHIYLTPPAGMI